MKKYKTTKPLCILLFFALFSFFTAFISTSSARFVNEIGSSTNSGIDNSFADIPYEVVTPVLVQTEGELTDALVNGYSLVQLDENLTDPVIMTGNSLNLVRDLILDLNGNEIQSNNIDSLLNIPTGRVLTIIDSAGGGGLYNPIGSVLQIDGGKLQVYGGKFESGPRINEYYSLSQSVIDSVATVTAVKGFSSQNIQMPIILPRKIDGINNGNVYFDQTYSSGSREIKSDTYFYMYVEDPEYNQHISTLDPNQATYAYSYTLYKDDEGNYSKSGPLTKPIVVTMLAYENVISKLETTDQKFGAVVMKSGNLDIGVRGNVTGSEVTQTGSFYSYFGKSNTSCVYFSGGTMQVETTGQFKTVNPAEVPDGTLAKNGEGSCIVCEENLTRSSSGVLTITSAVCTAYNDSIIEMKGGTLNVSSGKFTKYPTTHHTTNPQDANAKYDSVLYLEDGEMILSNAEIDIVGTSYSYGILAKGSSDDSNAKLNCTNVNYTLSGTNSYGIYATHGTININGGKFNLENNKSCYGVYAVTKSSTTPVEINLKNAELKIGGTTMYELDAENGNIIPACVGVYLNSSEYAGGKVNLDNVKIESVEVGVAVNSGTLTLKNGGNIKTHNASAIVLRSDNANNSNVIFENNSTTSVPTEYVINSAINRKGEGSTTSKISDSTIASNAGTHLYKRTLPWLGNVEYVNNDAIYVNGGNLTSYGKLNITHRGLYNDYNIYTANNTSLAIKDSKNYNRLVIKSFAVMVNSGNVTIRYANITNSVGGGVKVAGGTATLGYDDTATGGGKSALEDITVNTTGTNYYATEYLPIANLNPPSTYAAWKFNPSLSGGYAITSRGGNLTVYNGSYTAQYASAVLATDKGAINIYDGKFDGLMTNNDNAKGGPSSHYGIKVTGKADIKIYGGFFDGRNGGAFINGLDANNRAVVHIAKGEFGTGNQDGFNVYNNSTVYFGSYTQNEQQQNGITNNTSAQNAIKVKAKLFPIAINPIETGNSRTSKITDIIVYIYYGSYTSSDATRQTAAIDSNTYAEFYMYNVGTYVSAQKSSNTSLAELKRYVRYDTNRANAADPIVYVDDTKTNPIRYYPYSNAS